jgi:glucose/arabinose dehydrogenase
MVYGIPVVNDQSLKVETVAKGLTLPTSMAFLDENNMLVLEKDSGNVRLITNGTLLEQPVLRVPVNHPLSHERGLLGIAISNASSGNSPTVFLYYTARDNLKNVVYKYEWNGDNLTNPSPVLELPAEPGPIHNGGKTIIGPDGYLYVYIGDVMHVAGQLQNHPEGSPPDDTGVILRVKPEDGSAAPGNPFASSGDASLNKYYAYGIRNGFGMDFDPVSGYLWETENGWMHYDEINLIKPGFNSGHTDVMGPSTFPFSEEELVNFTGSHYSDPVLSWLDTVGLTDIEFYTSSELGDRYRNNIFVGDINNGNLYFFEVNETRNGLKLGAPNQESGLSDLVVDNDDDLSLVTFGTGFNGITEIETGPDGSLYLLSFGDGSLYKISKTK